VPKIDNSNVEPSAINGVRFFPIASPSRGSTETALWRAVVQPGLPGVVHHMTREEIIVAVAGEGVVTIGDTRERLAPGDAFAVPAFTDFRLESGGDTPFEAVVALPVGGRAVVGTQPSFFPPWSL
jgi:mannose-6-phosphate isomerase-like protein (cupin superfamily)